MSVKKNAAIVASTIGLSIFIGACVTYTQKLEPVALSRGLKPSHAPHIELELECTLCHEPQEGGEMSIPTHDLCVACHEFDLDNPEPEACAFCHTSPDYAVAPMSKLLGDELKWDHAAHIEADADCSVCHENPEQEMRFAGGTKPFCMDCHASVNPELNECSVCHNELSTEVVPKFRGGARIAHDSPEVWERVHGRESQVDPAYCTMCHGDQQAFCDDCHTKVAPKNHTIAWQRRTHGIQAGWDRQSCAVCHEEESCLQCHRNVEPASHRSGWGRPLDRHCANCHFPPTDTGCVVCHESIDHASALPSPHRFNIYPANCRICHPGGRPNQAPHPTNSTVNCQFCH